MKNIFFPLSLISFILIVISCNSSDNDLNKFNSKFIQNNIDVFKGFYFIAEDNKHHRLLYYNFIEDSIFSIFDNKSENVIEVSHNIFNNVVYFITIKKLDQKLEIPEFKGIKLYRYDPTKKVIEFISEFPPAIQIYSYWMDINRFKTITISFDEIVASYINKRSLIYNPFGKLLSEENKTFDFIKSGFPVKETQIFNLNSFDNNFNLLINSDSVTIINKKLNRSRKILNNVSVINLKWLTDQEYLIINYDNRNKKMKNILIYDLINNKIVKNFEHKGIKNFLVIHNYLIYDYNEGNSQIIKIFNLKKLLTVKKLSVGKNSYVKNIY